MNSTIKCEATTNSGSQCTRNIKYVITKNGKEEYVCGTHDKLKKKIPWDHSRLFQKFLNISNPIGFMITDIYKVIKSNKIWYVYQGKCNGYNTKWITQTPWDYLIFVKIINHTLVYKDNKGKIILVFEEDDNEWNKWLDISKFGNSKKKIDPSKVSSDELEDSESIASSSNSTRIDLQKPKNKTKIIRRIKIWKESTIANGKMNSQQKKKALELIEEYINLPLLPVNEFITIQKIGIYNWDTINQRHTGLMKYSMFTRLDEDEFPKGNKKGDYMPDDQVSPVVIINTDGNKYRTKDLFWFGLMDVYDGIMKKQLFTNKKVFPYKLFIDKDTINKEFGCPSNKWIGMLRNLSRN